MPKLMVIYAVAGSNVLATIPAVSSIPQVANARAQRIADGTDPVYGPDGEAEFEAPPHVRIDWDSNDDAHPVERRIRRATC